MPKPFVFNDQTLANSYGFRILTAGISLKRFKKNPIMLDDHYNSTRAVLGKWENLKVDNDLLLGEPLFDVAKASAAEVAGQVEREFINSCSMGITFKREDLKIIGTELIMEKCELYEVSIVAVPSNANSIRLYADNGELLKDDEVKQLCLSLSTEVIPELSQEEIDLKINPETMKKIVLSLAVLSALGFDKTATEQEFDEVEKRVLSLSEKLNTATAKLLAMETEKENAQAKEITDTVALAIAEGRISATKKEDFEALGKANLALMKSTLEGIPKKIELAAQTVPPAGTGATANTKEEFQKLSLEAQLAFKTSNPAEYQKLFSKN